MRTGNPILQVNFSTQPIYEIGAIVLTVLLFSQPKDSEETRAQAVAALCAWALHMRAAANPAWANEPLSIKPCYVMQSPKDVDGVLKSLKTRMQHRLKAGRLVMPFLQTALTGEYPLIGKKRTKPVVTNLAAYVLPDPDKGEVSDVLGRSWAPSKSVLHLAGAFEAAHHVLHKNNIQLDYMTMLWSEEFIRYVLHVAQAAEPLIERCAKELGLEVDPSNLIRIRITDRKSIATTPPVPATEPTGNMGQGRAHDTRKTKSKSSPARPTRKSHKG